MGLLIKTSENFRYLSCAAARVLYLVQEREVSVVGVEEPVAAGMGALVISPVTSVLALALPLPTKRRKKKS